MEYLSRYSKPFFLQVALYLFVNGLFILKYFPRSVASPPVLLAVYFIFVFFTVLLYKNYSEKISEKIFKIAYWAILSLMIFAIIGLLILIDRYSVRVDRWSAVTFFLDNFFQGKYPYSAHTHVSDSNFPSPFPVWYIVNLPFYFIGDVGIGLIFFLLLTAIVVQYLFSSFRKSVFFLLLFCLSPAYWWEVAVRSDSLSNALLVFVFIVWYRKQKYTLSNNFLFTIIACGLLASTRLSAILPLALFFFKPFVELLWRQKIFFPLGVLGIVLLTFGPFIFWDTHSWIFFSRNPFMSQTSVGNPVLLLAMIILGGLAAFQWKNTKQLFFVISVFLFVFILSSQVSLIVTRGVHGSVFEDSLYDISYFSLILPYTLAYLTSNKETEQPVC